MLVKFFTLGCKVNQYETQGLAEDLSRYGCRLTDEKADLYVINTCTVTKRADIKSKKAVIKARRENPGAKIAVCGCLVQLNRDFVESLDVDYVVPQDKKHYLGEIIFGRETNNKSPWLKISKFFNNRVFLKVQDGCNNSCSFCKIPYLRGPSRSRDKSDVLKEVNSLIKASYREIILCGINLAFYGRDLAPRDNLARLVKEIIAIKGLGRLRLSSLEPGQIDDELLSLLGNPKLCPHLHLPFQSGDDAVLFSMNKKDTVKIYRDIVQKARKVNPSIAISCDIMVGFPDEREENFMNTIKFLEEIKPMRIHVFRFSPREKTRFAGFKLKGHKEIKQRLDVVKRIGERLSFEYKKKFLGKNLELVAEEEKGDYISGYSENYIKVYIKDKVPLRSLQKVTLINVTGQKALGKIYAS